MTENLLTKLEEKMMILLAEVEDLRKKNHRLNGDVARLNNENVMLKNEKDNYEKKLESILGLIDDTVNAPDHSFANVHVAA